ncbi:hypothetical protein PY093_16455 [Cytobacillus sp. S13-E01]|uniref:SWIM zinc finger family protein n=1 Tax=Cytobacillus sp. S13-E01 TaxID=3031326 RepID=UPI0023D86D50|nr:hypothetical protein [Cytobacillus sp. S13-E01]MDF0728258.1 hypothetical protein [Cytobacillus sp. S13-E01]
MNITNFKRYIDKTILDRGYIYYIEGNVVKAYKQGENEYLFHIEGTDDYEVLVEIRDNGDILYSECDCPYDFGPVCKHEVAAYFQLYEILNQVTVNDNKVGNKTYKQSTIQEVLNNLSKEELINIIINITHNNATLENSLMVKFSKGDNQQELEACQELINSIVRKYTGREGFIKYRNTRDFVIELEDVVEKAKSTENVLLALDIALLLLEEAMDAFQYADDSGGDIGSLVTETLELIGEIAIKCKEIGHQRKAMFEKLLDQIDNEVFDGWLDYKIDLLNICFEFADDETLREQLRVKIESMYDKKSNDRYTHYGNERMLQLLFRLIEQYGTQEEAEHFIHQHLQFSSFREKLLNKYLQEKNYHNVLELAKEGEKQDQQYPGLISKWKKFRHEAYKYLQLNEEQRNLAKELLFDGDFTYYHVLKELASENQEVLYTNLKQELKTGKGWHTSRIFLKLIEEENDLEEMLEFVRDNPRYIEDYAEKLAKHVKEDVINIYKKYIKSTASSSSNRRDYQGVCHKLTRYKKIAGKREQMELIDELLALYKKRPAFIDELGKIK